MWQIIKHKKIWFSLSGLLLLGSFVIILQSGLPLGIDFTGGTLLEVALPPESGALAANLEKSLRAALSELTEVRVQPGDEGFIIRTTDLTEAQHQVALNSLEREYGSVTQLRFETVGPTLGSELKDKAITALLVSAIVIILYITWSFRKVSEPVSSWKYGLGALLALLHDVVIVTGVYTVASLSGRYQMDALFVTALLVVLGYSVNDTIVVYDRVRENVLGRQVRNFADLVNISVNQTVGRSINTSFTTLLVLGSLFIWGGASIQGFVLALIIGIVIGTYSSIFLASPLLVVWSELSRRKGNK